MEQARLAGARPAGSFGAGGPGRPFNLHAGMLHRLGIEHEQFAVKHQGLDRRLAGVEHALVVKVNLV